MTRPVSFEKATAQYVHRYTMEHVPAWARTKARNGKYYAPHFKSDREWYDATLFPGESTLADSKHCFTSGHTWPVGEWLDEPFKR